MKRDEHNVKELPFCLVGKPAVQNVEQGLGETDRSNELIEVC